MLLVYAGFTQDINAGAPGYSGGDWPQDDGIHPTGESFPSNAASLSYTSLSQFSPTATDPSFSNLYYQMTQFSPNPLKMIIHTFPKRINVTANNNMSIGDGFMAYSNLALEALKNDPDTPNYDFSQVDKRTNHPGFQFDNSQTGPDGIVDFVVVVWRTTGSPYQMASVNYHGGFASLGYYNVMGIPQAGSTTTYSMNGQDGFTQSDSQYGLTGLERGDFMHEFMHCLSQSPHYNTAHTVVGTHFYTG